MHLSSLHVNTSSMLYLLQVLLNPASLHFCCKDCLPIHQDLGLSESPLNPHNAAISPAA